MTVVAMSVTSAATPAASAVVTVVPAFTVAALVRFVFVPSTVSAVIMLPPAIAAPLVVTMPVVTVAPVAAVPVSAVVVTIANL